MPKLNDKGKLIHKKDGGKFFVCKGCEEEFHFIDHSGSFSKTQMACKFHERECKKLIGFGHKISAYLARRFTRKHGFHGGLMLTDMLEYLYIRHLWDNISALIWGLLLLGQVLVFFGVYKVPYGLYTIEGTNEFFWMLVSMWKFGRTCADLKFFKYKVMDNIPFLKDEIQRGADAGIR